MTRTGVFLAALLAGVSAAWGASCEGLSALKLKDTTIKTAQVVAASAFTLPNGTAVKDLPAFCRVTASVRPTTDSDIWIEVWLPAEGWNGRFVGVGNGGWSGGISYGPLRNALRQGYATGSTDGGHEGNDAGFALHHPEKVVDFGYRAVHLMTVEAKAITAAFYGGDAKYSYWTGCSSGGKQGLREAQTFPQDYDGIVAGAPANYWTHLMAGDMTPGIAALKNPANTIPREKFAMIHKAVVDACDGLDGVKDGLIENPARCRFDPAMLACKGADEPTCLTAPQVETARTIYAGAVNPRTHQEIFPGLAPGSELGWAALAGGPKPFDIVDSYFKYLVFEDPNWDFRTLDLDKEVTRSDRMYTKILNAADPNLKAFAAHGGKLLLYHGWNDELISPQNTINYYQQVGKVLGPERTSGTVRLFMAPGVAHCGGGEGPSEFDSLALMRQWVEQGKAPERIVAAGKGRTRPLCLFPQVAKYKGTGSTDEADSFVCADQR